MAGACLLGLQDMEGKGQDKCGASGEPQQPTKAITTANTRSARVQAVGALLRLPGLRNDQLFTCETSSAGHAAGWSGYRHKREQAALETVVLLRVGVSLS